MIMGGTFTDSDSFLRNFGDGSPSRSSSPILATEDLKLNVDADSLFEEERPTRPATPRRMRIPCLEMDPMDLFQSSLSTPTAKKAKVNPSAGDGRFRFRGNDELVITSPPPSMAGKS